MSHVQKRTRNGRTTYLARWRTADRKEHRKSFTRKTDATRFLVEIEDSKLRGAYVDPSAGRLDLRTQAERWYATTAALKPPTRRDYRSLLDNHVLPRFADWPLSGIDTLAVKEWRAAMVDGGLGGKRAGKAMQVLSLVLSSAVEGGRLATNKAAGVKPPKVQRREMLFLDAAEVERLADAIDPRWRVLVLLSAYTGLRPCEVVALKVGRLDLLRGTVRVAEAAPEVAGHLEWGSVKMHEARTVHIPRFLRDELAAHLAHATHGPDSLVFTAARGGSIRVQVGAGLLQAGGGHGGLGRPNRPPRGQGCARQRPALVRPAPHRGEPAHPRGGLDQGGSEADGPRNGGHHAGRLRPPVPGRATGPRRAAGGAPRTDRALSAPQRRPGRPRDGQSRRSVTWRVGAGGGARTLTPLRAQRF